MQGGGQDGTGAPPHNSLVTPQASPGADGYQNNTASECGKTEGAHTRKNWKEILPRSMYKE